MMREKPKALLFCSLALGSVFANHLEATPIVSRSISVADLNGTNGVVFINQNDSGLLGIRALLFSWFSKRFYYYPWSKCPCCYSTTHHFFSSTFNCLDINGTNGFFTREIFGGFDTYISSLWPSNKYILGVSTISKYGQNPLHLLSYTNQMSTSQISLTSSMWYSSLTLRCYITNDNPILTTVSFGGNFKKNSYALFVYSAVPYDTR